MRPETYRDRKHELNETAIFTWRLNNWPRWAKFLYLYIPLLRQDLIGRMTLTPIYRSRIQCKTHWILGDVEYLRRQ